MYFTGLWSWTVYFLNRVRTTSALFYLGISSACIFMSYLTDYHSHPLIKHVYWYSFIISFGMSLGITVYKSGFMFLFDVLYLAANSFSFAAILQYYSEFPNKGMLFNSYAVSFFAMIYAVGFLRLIRCGLDLLNY